MATLRQKRAAKLIVENLQAAEPLTGGEIVESSGFGPSMKKNPKVVLESKGVQEELINTYGFNTETVDGVVLEILTAGENDSVKLNAADKMYKRLGSYAAEKHITLNLDESTEHTRELGNRIIGLLRQGNRPSF